MFNFHIYTKIFDNNLKKNTNRKTYRFSHITGDQEIRQTEIGKKFESGVVHDNVDDLTGVLFFF